MKIYVYLIDVNPLNRIITNILIGLTMREQIEVALKDFLERQLHKISKHLVPDSNLPNFFIEKLVANRRHNAGPTSRLKAEAHSHGLVNEHAI